jgi:hypothetical protein
MPTPDQIDTHNDLGLIKLYAATILKDDEFARQHKNELLRNIIELADKNIHSRHFSPFHRIPCSTRVFWR